KPSYELWAKIAYIGIIGWEGISVQDENGQVTEEFKTEHLDSLPEDILLYAGEYIYKELTELTEDEIHKLRGHMRFLIWASKPEHKVYLDNFDCQSCLKKGLAKGRNCSKLTSEE